MSFHHVLGVLGDDEDGLRAVLDDAVRLAEAERARLTLAKTTDPGRIAKWLGPCALLSLMVPMTELLSAESDLQEIAGYKLARAAEFVPASIPITTLLLGPNTRRSLLTLINSGTYDVLVANAALLARSPSLNRELRRLGVCGLASPRPRKRPADLSPRPSPGTHSPAQA